MRLNLFLFSLALMLIFSCNDKKSAEQASDENNKSISSVKLTSLSGEPLEWKQYEGKTVFINFWATWCKPCIEEMPYIRNLMRKMDGENIAFLFASDETPEQINRFRERTGFDLPYVRSENMEELNIMALPTTFIFNPSGKLVYSEMGFRKWDDGENSSLIQKIINTK